jgi:NADPH:quinone reductase-like Zn-dependent oxidoreductase
MRQVWIPRIGAPEVLEVREAADPTPAPGEVRIAVEAAGVNFADLMARQGLYPDAPPLPAVVGYEAAGTIDAVGEGVDASRIGQGVLVMVRFGGYSSMICVPAERAIPRPEGMSAQVGAALPVVYLTAWMLLRVMGRVERGDRVLIHAAAGGVGLAAIDLCKDVGAEIWGSAGPGKHEFLRERGVHHTLDSRADEMPTDKMDLILDARGGESWAKGLAALRAGGRLGLFGMSSMSAGGNTRSILNVASAMWAVPWLKMNPVALINDNKGVFGVNMGHLWDESDRVTGWVEQVVEKWKAGALHPHVHATVPFAQAAEAHHILHRRENVGKVLLVP